MTQEEKQLLLKDLCARLPYGVIIKSISGDDYGPAIDICYPQGVVAYMGQKTDAYTEEFLPYLRPMSSMTEEELKELKEETGLIYDYENGLDLAEFQNNHKCLDFYLSEVPSYVVVLVFDWLNAHHFDYRGLIEKSLAIVAPDNMYKTD
jgi:hypothetical protein